MDHFEVCAKFNKLYVCTRMSENQRSYYYESPKYLIINGATWKQQAKLYSLRGLCSKVGRKLAGNIYTTKLSYQLYPKYSK